MHEAKNTGKGGIRDRWLGDEWLDWESDRPGYSGIINEGKATFLIFVFTLYLIFLVSSSFLFYLIYPRLHQIHAWIPRLLAIASAAFFALLLLWLLLIVATVITGRNFLLRFVKKSYLINSFYRLAARLGERLGISRDRMSNSFIKVNNVLQKFICRITGSDDILVLLPRCLSLDVRKKIQEICKKYDCRAFIATGGDSARRIIQETKPLAIIGVACERDLVSGIEDTTPKIPVIGIENKRPDGPCKNTFVDVDLFEETLSSLVGRHHD